MKQRASETDTSCWYATVITYFLISWLFIKYKQIICADEDKVVPAPTHVTVKVHRGWEII